MVYKYEVLPCCYFQATLRSFRVTNPLFRMSGPEFLILTQAADNSSTRSTETAVRKMEMGPAPSAVFCKLKNKPNKPQNKQLFLGIKVSLRVLLTYKNQDF